jgi:hypothetical protein
LLAQFEQAFGRHQSASAICRKAAGEEKRGAMKKEEAQLALRLSSSRQH